MGPQKLSQHPAALFVTPWRKTSAISRGDAGFSTIIGCDIAKTSARNVRAAWRGGKESSSRYGSKRRVSAGLSAIGCFLRSWKRVPTLDASRHTSTTRRWANVAARVTISASGKPGSIVTSNRSNGAGSSAASITAPEQLVLVRERTEDGALGDSRRVRDLAGRHHLAVLEQERNGGLDDHRPPLVGRKRRGAPPGRCHSHGPQGMSENSLTQPRVLKNGGYPSTSPTNEPNPTRWSPSPAQPRIVTTSPSSRNDVRHDAR